MLEKGLSGIVLILLGMANIVCASNGDIPGAGTALNPYLIQDCQDFKVFSNVKYASIYWDSGVHVRLDADLNLLDSGVFPDSLIADYDSGQEYSGIFDGNNHVIRNVNIKSIGEYCGLFGTIGFDGVILDLGLIDVSVSTESDYAGAFAGENYGEIKSCYSDGKVYGGEGVGGLVGHNFGNISKCYSKGVVSGNIDVGGLVGLNENTVTLSYSKCNVFSGSEDAGGLIGDNTLGEISNCYSLGNVSGDKWVGGFVGFNDDGSILNCYSAGEVSGGDYDHVGGFVGDSTLDVDISGCFWDVESSGKTHSYEGIGLTTSQMKDINSYLESGWEFFKTNGSVSIWKMPGEDYPILSWQNIIDIDEFALLAGYWLGIGCDKSCDCYDVDWYVDEVIDINDLLILVENWLDTDIDKYREYVQIEDSFESGDFSANDWISSGDAVWGVVSGTDCLGDYSARSGGIDHDEKSSLSIDLSSSEYSTISFSYKVSSEGGYDFLVFYINDIEQDRWSGEVSWSNAAYQLPPGAVSVSWKYIKDETASDGFDTAWIDNVVISKEDS